MGFLCKQTFILELIADAQDASSRLRFEVNVAAQVRLAFGFVVNPNCLGLQVDILGDFGTEAETIAYAVVGI